MSPPAPPGPSTRVAVIPHRRLEGGVRVEVVAGPDRGRTADLGPGVHLAGTGASCALALSDPLVSRRHLEIAVSREELRLRDLGSTNGSYFQGARFESIRVAPGALVRIGDTELRLVAPGAAEPAPDRCGRLVGSSARMKEVFSLLERAAPGDLTVLIQGETGTGKELAAEALHAASARAAGPLVICDLAAVSPGLAELELFGCVRGAIPGADADRAGAFAQAEGGTLLLDEVADLDLEVQPRLLRAIERRQIKPVGAALPRTVDVRIVASTNRDLAAEVEAGRFREDLYHRLAVMKVVLPALRERREDIPRLVEHILAEASEAEGRPPPAVPPETMAALAAHDWPGNVRELRNVLERALSLSGSAPTLDVEVLGLEAPVGRPQPVTVPGGRKTVPFKEAKERLVDAWEREYLVALLDRAQGNISLAARRAGIARVYLHQLIKKHHLERKEKGTEEV